MNGLHTFLTPLDWGVVAAYLFFTTLAGISLRGKQATIRDFFLGGRSLPWPAVSASIIATEISALALIGLPGSVMALNGDFTYLQWAIGSILAGLAGCYLLLLGYLATDGPAPFQQSVARDTNMLPPGDFPTKWPT